MKPKRMPKLALTAIIFASAAASLLADETRLLEVLYLRIAQEKTVTLSNLDPIPDDLGQMGARLGADDANTTGRFMGYQLEIDEKQFRVGDLAGAMRAVVESDAKFVLLDMSAEQIAEISGLSDRLFFNVRDYDDRLRGEDCRPNLLHTIPSYAMRADALMQFLRKKNWDKLVLIEGAQEEDALFASALRNSAEKFGMNLESDIKWLENEDIRRAASAEVPLYTQQFGDYDAMIIADEANDFARYFQYNTWESRPIFGGDGLKSVAWSRVMEQWGAAQLQSRFGAMAERDMQDEDYAAWAAIRAIDESYVRSGFGDFAAIQNYLLGEDFALGGFKGVPLSFRDWNGQMRQPIGLVSASALVAMAPIEGYLHATNPLDSLGADEAETTCKNFEQ